MAEDHTAPHSTGTAVSPVSDGMASPSPRKRARVTMETGSPTFDMELQLALPLDEHLDGLEESLGEVVSTPGLWEAMSMIDEDEALEKDKEMATDCDAGDVEWGRMEVLMDSYEYRERQG